MKCSTIIRTAVLAVLLFAIMNIAFEERVEARQEDLASRLIRFHVRANSDSDFDQQLKMRVKEAVVLEMEQLLRNSTSVEESQNIIENHIEELLQCGMNVIHSAGMNYELRGYMVEEYFPLRTYGNIALPPGRYKAFRIDIGEAKGKNWWCVLYPPLCFVDISHGTLSDDTAAQLEKAYLEKTYLIDDEKNKIDYELDFKYLKFIKDWVR